MMKALFIGGTGTISTAISKLAIKKGWELYLLNRGNRSDRVPEEAKLITADINDEETVSKLICNLKFDVVADFIAFTPSHIERDFRLFSNKTNQYIFISSESAYQKPLSCYKITESTPLSNRYYPYSRGKIACEELLSKKYREDNFPITIVRPGHTYDERNVPLDIVPGKCSSWQIIDRIIKNKPVVVVGDGTSLWTVTHSSDFAKAFVGVMSNRAAIGESVHITSDEVLTWNDIYDCIGTALNVEVKKVHVSSEFLAACWPELEGCLIGDKSNCAVFDNSKIKRLVPDYIATMRFDQGVRLCIKNILSHPELQILDEELDRFLDNVIMVQQEALISFKKLNNKIE
jgi:nucleoside-diphosphate-sugar epimerase